MIENLVDQIFNAIKYNVGFYRSKRFKFWFHQFYPGKIQHHAFGSYGSRKTSDYCSVPVTAEELEQAHKNAHEFAIDNLPKMINVMTEYILYLEKIIEEKRNEH